MSGFNKVTSFVLGLIVVVVFLLVFGSRFRVADNLEALKNKTTPTPTLSISPTPKKGFFESLFARKTTPTPGAGNVTPTPRVILGTSTDSSSTTNSGQANTPQTTKGGNSQAVNMHEKPQNIPNTGAPTLLLPALFASLGAGVYLRKKS